MFCRTSRFSSRVRVMEGQLPDEEIFTSFLPDGCRLDRTTMSVSNSRLSAGLVDDQHHGLIGGEALR